MQRAPVADTLAAPRIRVAAAEHRSEVSGWHWRLFVLALVVSDLLMIALGLAIAYTARFHLGVSLFRLEVTPSPVFYALLGLKIVPLWLLIYLAVGLYRRSNLLGGTREYSLVFRATTTGIVVVIVVEFLDPSVVIARGWLLLAWAATILLVCSGRWWLRRGIYGLRRRGYFQSRTLVVGLNEEARLMAEQLLKWPTSGLHLVGWAGDEAEGGIDGPAGLRLLGGWQNLDEIVEKYQIEELILATSALSREQILAIFKQYGVSKTVNLRLSSGLFEIITTGLRVNEMAYVPLVSVDKVRLTGADRLLKEGLDYGLALPGTILLLPLLAVIALAVRLDSAGPVIHRRRVMGLNGIEFDAFKFRTMYVHGEEILARRPELAAELKANHKVKDDPRVTRVGRFLRKYSLDELPQLFNVLRWEMSLVGPRMISPEEMANYNQWGINLLTVRPGLTGLWQVSGRSDLSYRARVQMDMYFIRNWSIWLELQILLQTIPAVLKSRGAY
jgi:exopolysaccharide biosynthesis polyprenyl glycosylphosphotransferase